MIVPRASPSSPGQHYDALDAFYRDAWGEHVHHGLFATGRETTAAATDALADRVIAAAEIGALSRAVDVGCGYGLTAHRAAVATGAHVTGLTLSEAQAAVARARPVPPGAPPPEIHVRDWLANTLPSAAFDAAWAVESTTHMPERARVFTEIGRVLKPGGRLVLCVWMAADAPAPWKVRHLLEPICREGRLAGMGTEAENRAWIEGAGLTVERFEDWSRAVAPTWTRVAGRVVRGLATEARYRQAVFRGEGVFALTVPRLIVAYRTGAMRYGFFVARKPAGTQSGRPGTGPEPAADRQSDAA